VESDGTGAGGGWKRVRGDLLLGLAFWSAVDLFFFSRLYVQIGVAEEPPFTARQVFGPHLLETAADVALWTLYTPLILHLARRFRLGRRLLPWAVHLGASLPLTVQDDGWELPPRVCERVGLGNTRTRLRQLYGDRHRFEVAAAPGGGTPATVEVPYRRAAGAAAREAPRLVEAR
jgi:hypothetical protein